MVLDKLKRCIDHDEATIRSFVRNPDFAEFYLKEVIADGDMDEIREVKGWLDEARARSARQAVEA